MYTVEKIIEENQIHKQDVIQGMNICKSFLNKRGRQHDKDKDIIENAEILADALNTKSFEEWEKIHCEKQSHHAECFLNLEDGDLFDLLELVVDGCVSNLRRNGMLHTLQQEKEFYIKKGFDEKMASILANTFIRLQNTIELDD